MTSSPSAKEDSITGLLENIAEELPIIRPISEFIHLNLLLPYQGIPFWEALKKVSSKFEAMPFLEQEFYRYRIQSGEIPREKVIQRLQKLIGNQAEASFNHFMNEDIKFTHHDQRTGRLHSLWNSASGMNIIQLADGMLIKWLGMYLDQGISLWSMPGAGEKKFYDTIRDLLTESYFLPSPFDRKTFQDIFPDNPDTAIQKHLAFLCPDKEFQKEYLKESILTLRGWAGLIYGLEKNHGLLQSPRKITLQEFISLKLILERAWITDHQKNIIPPDFSRVRKKAGNLFVPDFIFEVFQVCHEILEENTYQKFLTGITNLPQLKKVEPQFQAVFCMDDRECSLRRHLEESVPGIQTYGTAGHFGIECLYQHDEDAFPKKQCPAPVIPKYFIKETKLKENTESDNLPNELFRPSHSLEDFFQSFTGAIKLTALLVKNLFFPLAFRKLENVKESNPATVLQFTRKDPVHTGGGLRPGYTVDEMTDLLYNQLRLIGLVRDFSPLIFIIGHGSNVINNSYFTTYGCGACSGRPGSANARIFVQMANNPEVRKKLSEKFSLDIPDSSFFIAGFHDTCKDVVEFYDTKSLPSELEGLFLIFKEGMSQALVKNSEERVRSFKSVTKVLRGKEAQKEVLKRSISLFETRPELGHTNVVFAVVGKRDLTKGMNFSRRSFLQSYDRNIDPSGEILSSSLNAVIPVTSGISLDYYFSRVDNLRFGAGSKLPQNIVGNFGISHGTESDLLCGLPFQMIDQHIPLRLFVLVEHSPDVTLKAIQGNQQLKEIVYNHWIYYGCWDEITRSFYLFHEGKMHELKDGADFLC